MSLCIYEGVEQIYIYLPGSMIENENVLSVNDLYIAYCSSVTVIILDKKTKIIKNIVYIKFHEYYICFINNN